jgi:hypothetical protein
MREVVDGPAMEAKIAGPPDASTTSQDGGRGETSPGGAGAGVGKDGTPTSEAPEATTGDGIADRVQGQFRPGDLSPDQEELLFDFLEARASVEGPFEQFGPEVGPYVTEAKSTLTSEPVDPRMKTWVESYLAQIAG